MHLHPMMIVLSLPFFSALMALLVLQLGFVQAAPHPSRRTSQSTTDWDPKLTPYPAARRANTTFSYRSAAKNGNVTVPDPYNFLEQSLSSSKEVQNFSDQQDSLFKEYFGKIKDLDAIRQSIKNAGRYDELGFPEAFGSKESPVYVYLHRDLGSDFRKIYVATHDEMEQGLKRKFVPLPGKKVLDESTLPKDKSYFNQNISPDGKTLLYRVQTRGNNDLVDIYLKDISRITGKGQRPNEYPERIGGGSDLSDGWTADSKGFFYVHEKEYEDRTFNQSSIQYHRLGTDAKDDIMVVSPTTGKELFFAFDVTKDKKFLIVYATDDPEKPQVYATSLDQPISENMKWISIVPEPGHQLEYLTNIGKDFFFIARFENESKRVVKYQLDFSQARSVKELSELKDKAMVESTVIPENKEAFLDVCTIFDNDKLLLCYTKDAKRSFFIYDLSSGKQIQQILQDYAGSASALTSLPSGTDIFLWSWSFNTPNELYHIKWNKEQNKASTEIVHEGKVNSIDLSKFTVEQRWAKSKDSTKVPFHLFYKSGTKFDGTGPLMIGFYGAYRVIWLPFYSPTYMSWVNDYDAIFVLAYPRGGGEVRAEEWHQAGVGAKKQNTIDDINAIIQHLIDTKVTAKGKIVLYGQFAGSSLTMAIANQATEGNIGAITLQNGMFDFLRFTTSSDGATIGIEEYGDPNDPKAFDWLKKISPLHNVDQSKNYPGILFLPGQDIDAAWNGRKMIAQLQYDLPSNPSPFFYHPPDTSKSDQDNIDDHQVFCIAFAAHVLNLQRVNH